VVAASDPFGVRAARRAAVGDVEPNLAQRDVAQRRGTEPPSSFPILFAPPAERRVEQVRVDGEAAPMLTDGDVATSYDPDAVTSGEPMVLDIELAPSTTARSVVVPLTGGDAPSALEAEVTFADGTTTTVDGDAVEATKRLITVHLGDREVRSIRLTVRPSVTGRTAVPRDVWAYAP
jgi:hypothetical protein